jgi:hypothetical protein
MDISKASRPKMIAQFIPPEKAEDPLGVFPYRDYVLASDMNNGLWIFQLKKDRRHDDDDDDRRKRKHDDWLSPVALSLPRAGSLDPALGPLAKRWQSKLEFRHV